MLFTAFSQISIHPSSIPSKKNDKNQSIKVLYNMFKYHHNGLELPIYHHFKALKFSFCWKRDDKGSAGTLREFLDSVSDSLEDETSPASEQTDRDD